MEQKKSRSARSVLALLLCAVLLLNMLPVLQLNVSADTSKLYDDCTKIVKGVDLVIVMDLSSSMRYAVNGNSEIAANNQAANWEQTRLYKMEQALKTMIGKMQDDNRDVRIAMADFGDLDHYEFENAVLDKQYRAWPQIEMIGGKAGTTYGGAATASSFYAVNYNTEIANQLNFILGKGDKEAAATLGINGTSNNSQPFYLHPYKYDSNMAKGYTGKILPRVYTGSKRIDADAFMDVDELNAANMDSIIKAIDAQNQNMIGTNYDVGLEYAYRLAYARQQQNIANGEDRVVSCIFMSDGAAMQYNYFSGRSQSESWSQYLLGNTDEILTNYADVAQWNLRNPTTLHPGLKWVLMRLRDMMHAGKLWYVVHDAGHHPNRAGTAEKPVGHADPTATAQKYKGYAVYWPGNAGDNCGAPTANNKVGDFRGAFQNHSSGYQMDLYDLFELIYENRMNDALYAAPNPFGKSGSNFNYQLLIQYLREPGYIGGNGFIAGCNNDWDANGDGKLDSGKVNTLLNNRYQYQTYSPYWYFYNTEGKNWWAEAMKGDTDLVYPVINRFAGKTTAEWSGDVYTGEVDNQFSGDTAPEYMQGKDYISGFKGLGMELYTIGFAITADDNMISAEEATTVLKNIATSEEHYYPAFDTDTLEEALTGALDDLIQRMATLRHDEKPLAAVEPDCVNTGLTEGVGCENCTVVLVPQEVIPALGHKEVVDKGYAATCTEDGMTDGSHCSVCNEVVVEKEVIPALGHDEVIDKAIAPDCTNTGISEGKHCDRCGETLIEQTVVDALGHTEVIDKAVAPTCTETGLTEGKHCSVCGEILVKQNVVDALGHDEVIDKAVAPDCDSTGLTEGKHCDRCGEILVKQNEVDALGHTEVIDKAVAPDCDTTGLTEGKHCSVCGETLVKQNEVNALGHDEVIDKAVAPTCTETGLTQGKHCRRCGKTLVAQEVVAKLGHIEVVDKAVAPTCTETGLTEGKHCITCGETLVKQNVVDALGHDEVIDKAVAPDCDTTGLTEGKHCDRCGEILVKQNEVKALGHDEVIDKAVAPTCTETGLTEGKHCARCGKTLVAQEVVAKLGHDEVIDKAVAPTCTETGLTEGKHCDRCGETLVKQNVVDALGHTKVTNAAKDPTCTEDGFTEGSYCSVCNEVFSVQSVVPALGHSFDAYNHCPVCGYGVYDIWVQGIQVTSENAADILGNMDTGATAVYDANTQTLTLNGAKLRARVNDLCAMPCGIAAEQLLNLVLEGENTITGTFSEYGISTNSDLTISGTGSLEMIGNCVSIQAGPGDITVNSGTVSGTAIYSGGGDITINGGDVIMQNSHDHGIMADIDGKITVTGGNVIAKAPRTALSGSGGVVIIGGSVVAYSSNEQFETIRTGMYSADVEIGGNVHLIAHNEKGYVYYNLVISSGTTGMGRSSAGSDFVDLSSMSFSGNYLEFAGGDHIRLVPTEGNDETHSYLCDCSIIEDTEISHDWPDTPCTEVRTCCVCGFTEKEARGHKEVIDKGYAATCTENGLTEGKHCSVCGDTLVAQTEIKALGHDEVIDKAVAATCTTDGLTEGNHCQRCDKVLVKQTVIGALGHSYGADDFCTACGEPKVYDILIGGVKITAANASDVFGDGTVSYDAATLTLTLNNADVRNGIARENNMVVGCGLYVSTVDTITIRLIGDSIVEGAASDYASYGMVASNLVITGDGTLTTLGTSGIMYGGFAIGSTLVVEEGATLTGNAISSLHRNYVTINGTLNAVTSMSCLDTTTNTFNLVNVYGDAVLDVDLGIGEQSDGVRGVLKIPKGASLTIADGVTLTVNESVLSLPNYITNNGTIILEGTGTIVNNGSGTCLEDDSNHVLESCVCLVCGETHHSWLDATCTEPETCADCGASRGIPLGHDEVIDKAVAATCTTSGMTEGKHCARCGKTLVAQEVVAKLGHDEVTDEAVDPTCTKTGLTQGSHCGRCGETLVAQEVVKALGHDEVIDKGYAATCTTDGLTDGKHCSACDEVLVAQEVVKALGHDEVIDKAVAATCTETGLTDGKHCDRCGEVLVAQDVIDALGHSSDKNGWCNACGCTVYQIWVQGIQITNRNASDVLGDLDQGATVVYDANTSTLTLNGAVVGAAEHFAGNGMTGIAFTQPLKLVLLGENTIHSAQTCIYGRAALTVSGTGLLNAYGSSNAISIIFADLTINGGTIFGTDIKAAGGQPANGKFDGGDILITGGVVSLEAGDRGIFANGGGSITITGGTIDVFGEKNAMFATKNITITGGCVEVRNNDSSEGTLSSYDDILLGGDAHILAVNNGGGTTVVPGFMGSGRFGLAEDGSGLYRTAADGLFADASAMNGNGGYFEFVGGEHFYAAPVEGDDVNHSIACDCSIGLTDVMLPHSLSDATCTEPKICKDCGFIHGDALGHDEVTDEAVDPTCTKTGLTQGSHCDRCGEVMVKQEDIPATGHSSQTWFSETNENEHYERRSCCGEVIGTERHVFGDDSVCDKCNARVNVLLTVGEVIYGYNSFTDALAAAQESEGSVLKLYYSAGSNTAWQISSGVFTIDLNGNSIQSNLYYVNTLEITGGDVTIIDSSAGKTGKIRPGNHTIKQRGGILRLLGGTVVNTQSDCYGLDVYNGTVYIAGASVDTISASKSTVTICGDAVPGVKDTNVWLSDSDMVINVSQALTGDDMYTIRKNAVPSTVVQGSDGYQITDADAGRFESWHSGCTLALDKDNNALIQKYSITNQMLALSDTESTYDGCLVKSAIVVIQGELTLIEGTDYVVTWSSEPLNAGTYTVTVTGVGNYAGAVSMAYTILPADISQAVVTVEPLNYTGQEQTAEVSSVVLNSMELTADCYTITGNTGTNVGTYTLTVKGQGNYTGTVVKTFTIACDHTYNTAPGADNGDGTHSLICSVCGEQFSRGHSYDEGMVTTDPTCTGNGVKTFTCAICGSFYTEKIDVLDHSADENGQCTVCGCTVYQIWVQGIQVTSLNASDVLGDLDQGATVVYDAETNTLTLNGATIKNAEKPIMNYYRAIVVNQPLEIVTVGTNTLNADVYSKCDLTFSGEGSLVVNGQYRSIVIDNGNLTVNSGSITCQSICVDEGDVLITGGVVSAQSGGVDTGGNMTVTGGTVDVYSRGNFALNVEGDLLVYGGSVRAENSDEPDAIHARGSVKLGSNAHLVAISVRETSVMCDSKIELMEGVAGMCRGYHDEWFRSGCESNSEEHYFEFVGSEHIQITHDDDIFHSVRCDCAFELTDAQAFHSWTKATCTEPETCKDCGFTHGDALGHAEVIDEAAVATCTKIGLTEGSHCDRCGKVFVAQEVIDALGHTEVIDKAVTPDCTNTGLTEGSHCDRCGEVFAAQDVIDALGHSYTDGVCTVCGIACPHDEISNHICGGCGKTVYTVTVDEDKLYAIELTEGFFALAGEDYVGKIIRTSTCTTPSTSFGWDITIDGVATTNFSLVGGVLTIPAEFVTGDIVITSTSGTIDRFDEDNACLGIPGGALSRHEVVWAEDYSYAAITYYCALCDNRYTTTCTTDCVTTDATCEEAGKMVYTASYRDIKVETTVVLEPNGHTEVIDDGYAATCSTDGKTEGKHCSVCSKVLVAQDVIPALGHDEVIDKGYAATCTENGLTDGKHCGRCGDVLITQDVIDALGHTEVIDKAVAATCVSTGLTEGKHCSVCNKVLVAQEIIPAVNEHVFENGSCINGCGMVKSDKVEGLKLVEASTFAFTVEWKPLYGALKYWVCVNGYVYNGTDETTMEVRWRNPSNEYTVSVIALMDDGKTILSQAKANTITVHTDKYHHSIDKTETSITMSWDVEGCTKSWIAYGTSMDNLKVYDVTTADSYTLPGLKPDTVYYIQMTHVVNGVSVTVNAIQAVRTLKPQPKVEGLTQVDATANSFTLSWDALSGADSYWVYINGNAYTSTKLTTLTIYNRKPGTSYTVAICAVMDDGTILALANAKPLTVTTLG